MIHNTARTERWPVSRVADALENRLSMDKEDAKATAETLHEIFHGKWVIEDTEVQSQQRSFLWSLLVEGIVTVETQERPRPEDGRRWRYFYWHLVPPERLARRGAMARRDSTIYDKLPAAVWGRGGSKPGASARPMA